MESDPNGLNQHEPGAKLDDGKIRVALVLGGFAKALYAVCAIGTQGAAKYTANGWKEVTNALARYDDAKGRHWLKDLMGLTTDDQSKLMHRAHEAWNSLAILEKEIEETYVDNEEFVEDMERLAKEVIKNLPKD